eukprot:Sspe_Gene.50596::Locus_28154_Transcript_1_1_Confidence_1.000_Length_1336::g.50596::m.50596/K13208/ELAVL2_3_4; ELAV like protein 2/3/4
MSEAKADTVKPADTAGEAIDVKPQPSSESKGEHSRPSLRNLIINFLPPTVTEQELEKLFSALGPIESVRIPKKGYGFVVYKDEESARKAIATMNEHEMGGHRLRVAYAHAPGQLKGSQGKNDVLYVSGFGSHWDKDKLQAVFTKFGRVKETRILPPNQQKYTQGVGFVRFANVAQAECALVNMGGKKLQELGIEESDSSKVLTVKYSDHRQDDPRALMQQQLMAMASSPYWQQIMTPAPQIVQSNQPPPVLPPGVENTHTILNVYNLAPFTTDDVLWNVFGQFGAVTSLTHPLNANGTSKGYCFVHYLRGAEAARALQYTDGAEMYGYRLKVSFKPVGDKVVTGPITQEQLEQRIKAEARQKGPPVEKAVMSEGRVKKKMPPPPPPPA